MSRHSGPSSHIHSPPSGNTTHAPPTLTPTTLAAGEGSSGNVRLEAGAPDELVTQRRRRRSTNYLPPINPITMMEEDAVDDGQGLGAASSVLEESLAEGSKRRTFSVDDLQVSGDTTSKRVRRSVLRQAKAASVAAAPATVARKRASTAKTSTASTLASSTSTASTSTASTSIASTSTASTSTASTSTASTSTASTSTASTSTAVVAPKATTKRKKRERPVASHPYVMVPLASIGEHAETSTAAQAYGSPSTSSVSHSGNYGQNQDLAQNHMLHHTQPRRASNSQDRSPDHLATSYQYTDGQQTPHDLHLQVHGYESHHQYTTESFNCSNLGSIHNHDAYAHHQEYNAPEPRGYQSHHQLPRPGYPQHSVYHAQPLAAEEMQFQHGHYPTRPLSIPAQVIDRTLRLHQAFYDWGFVDGLASVFDQTIHNRDHLDHQRQTEYQKRWEMYERGLQVGIAIAQVQHQQPQNDPAHWDPVYASPTQRLPSRFSTPVTSSPPLRTRENVTAIILPALPAGGPLPRVPLGQTTLPILQSQSDLPESLDQDWFVLPKIMTFPPTSPPPSGTAGPGSRREQAGRTMLAAESSSTSTPSMLDSSSAAASSASTCSPPSAPDTPRRRDHFSDHQQA
ncbi:hypothetical protein BGZ68_008419 [Mortierella alpina]|nr:hypothetical protein BGZ68_008419 [Mortierella alpina]